MPVSCKKKRITPAPDASTLEPSPPMLPGQQEFHHYLRTLAQRAVRTVIEAVMREELAAFIGAVILLAILRFIARQTGRSAR